jgi:hypothetical protein
LPNVASGSRPLEPPSWTTLVVGPPEGQPGTLTP